MPTETRLKGVSNISQSLLNDQLEANLVEFFNWGTLCIGAFSNVNIPTSGVYGGNFHRLNCVKDPRYTDGQVWQGARQNWVWESGLEYGTQPISISGIFVNNVFRPNGSGYIIDYPRGRVIFDTAISTTGVVHLAYSYKYINFISSSEIPFFKEIQYDSFRVDDRSLGLFGSGNWSILGENRLQLPAVVITATPGRKFKGYELGGGQYVYQDVYMQIIAETVNDRKQLIDILSYQNEKTLHMFDKNGLANANMFPIKYDGSLNSNPRTYPDLIQGSGAWSRDVRLSETRVLSAESTPPLYGAIVKTTCEVIMGDL